MWPAAAFALLAAGGAVTTIASSPEDSSPVGVVLARRAEDMKPAAQLDASGYVVARRQTTIAAKITARIREISIEEGQYVSAGQVMVQLDDSNTRAAVLQAEAQLRQAEAHLSAARVALADEAPIFRRRQELNARGWTASSALDEERTKFDASRENVKVAEAALAVSQAGLAIAQRNQDDTIVRAPYSGLVTAKAAQPGEIVSPLSAGGGLVRTGIGTLVDMDSLEVDVDLSENIIDRVRPDQECEVRLNAYPNQALAGFVIAIVPTADRSKATVKVRVGLRDKDRRILPEMGARVAFLATPASPRPAAAEVLLPSAAVRTEGGDAVVFVVKGDIVERRRIRLGALKGDEQAVVDGLAPGELVATGNLGKLSDGAAIRRANR